MHARQADPPPDLRRHAAAVVGNGDVEDRTALVAARSATSVAWACRWTLDKRFLDQAIDRHLRRRRKGKLVVGLHRNVEAGAPPEAAGQLAQGFARPSSLTIGAWARKAMARSSRCASPSNCSISSTIMAGRLGMPRPLQLAERKAHADQKLHGQIVHLARHPAPLLGLVLDQRMAEILRASREGEPARSHRSGWSLRNCAQPARTD